MVDVIRPHDPLDVPLRDLLITAAEAERNRVGDQMRDVHVAMSVSDMLAGCGIDSHRLAEYWPAVEAALCRANHRDQAWALPDACGGQWYPFIKALLPATLAPETDAIVRVVYRPRPA